MAGSLTTLYGKRVEEIDDNDSQRVPIACPLCGPITGVPRYLLSDVSFQLAECERCGLAMAAPMPNDDEIASFYPSAYYGSTGRKFSTVVEWVTRAVGRRQARFIARRVPKGGRVLDVGCGRGVLLSGLASFGLRAEGTEISSHAHEGNDARVTIHVVHSLRAAQFDDDTFDCVVIWHVLEHLRNPRETLVEMFRILRPGGIAVVAVPNYSSWQARLFGRHWFHLDPPRHLFHFPSETLQSLLDQAGFREHQAHHFSLRQNPFGWIQSALNALWPDERNQIYTRLQRSEGRTRISLFDVVVLVVLTPVAVVLSIVAAVFKRGGTVHLVSVKPAGNF